MRKIKFEHIANLAKALSKKGSKMSASELADSLNRNFGSHYKREKRGIYSQIRAAFKYFEKKGNQKILDNIANTFVNKKGEHVWKK